MEPHSSAPAWKIPGTEEPGGLQSTGSLRVGHDWATSLSLFTFMLWRRKWQPTPVFLPGESQGRGSLVGCPLWGRTESDTTEVTWQQRILFYVVFPLVCHHTGWLFSFFSFLCISHIGLSSLRVENLFILIIFNPRMWHNVQNIAINTYHLNKGIRLRRTFQKSFKIFFLQT